MIITTTILPPKARRRARRLAPSRGDAGEDRKSDQCYEWVTSEQQLPGTFRKKAT